MDGCKELIPTSMTITSILLLIIIFIITIICGGDVSIVCNYIMEWTGEYDKLVPIITDDH